MVHFCPHFSFFFFLFRLDLCRVLLLRLFFSCVLELLITSNILPISSVLSHVIDGGTIQSRSSYPPIVPFLIRLCGSDQPVHVPCAALARRSQRERDLRRVGVAHWCFCFCFARQSTLLTYDNERLPACPPACSPGLSPFDSLRPEQSPTILNCATCC